MKTVKECLDENLDMSVTDVFSMTETLVTSIADNPDYSQACISPDTVKVLTSKVEYARQPPRLVALPRNIKSVKPTNTMMVK